MSPTQPKSARHRVGRERILDAAEALFTTHGYRAVSVRDIAEACGVTNAALYYHFPSKEALFREVWLRHLRRLQERLQEAAARPGTYPERLQAALEVYLSEVAARRATWFSWRRDVGALRTLPEEDRRALAREAERCVLGPLEQVLQEAVAAGALQPLPERYSPAGALLGLVHGLLHAAVMRGEPVQEQEIARLAVALFWHGLQALPPSE